MVISSKTDKFQQEARGLFEPVWRSQHDNQSWLAALTTILDASAIVIAGIDGAPVRQAELTFAMARHALVDLAQIFNTPPCAPI
jgi:hypothetical protein